MFIPCPTMTEEFAVSPYTTRSSRPHESVVPRSHRDPVQRYQTYGPIRPMDSDRGFLARLFDRLF